MTPFRCFVIFFLSFFNFLFFVCVCVYKNKNYILMLIQYQRRIQIPCRLLSSQQNNTTFRYSSLVDGLCANLCFLIHRILELSGFSTAHAYKYKTKQQAKMKRDSRKMTFLSISHQATLELEKQRLAHRP